MSSYFCCKLGILGFFLFYWSLTMDDDMKIDASTVRRLRTERAWSQEQLAASADVSLRTIQRVE